MGQGFSLEIMTILKLIHAFLGLNAMVSGIAVCIRMISGRSFEESVAHFLRFSLAASSVGLVFSLGHTGLIQLLAVLGVCVSAFAVVSRRKFKSNEKWVTTLVLSTMCVLCLDSLIVVVHVFDVLAICSILGWPQPEFLFSISMAATVLLFAVLSPIAVKKNHYGARAPVLHKVSR
jgi:hypothetical protein